MKVNAFALRSRKTEPKSFLVTDEANPGVEVVIKLVPPTIISMSRIGELVEDYSARYCGENPLPFFPIDGKVPELNKSTIELACTIQGLQESQQTNEDYYTVEEIIALLFTMPNGMMTVVSATQKMSEEVVGLIQNPTNAPVVEQSQSFADSTEDTLNLTTD